MSSRGARWALKRACAEGDMLSAAYLRLLVAFDSGDGVRLTSDEVWALCTLDSAIESAAVNILNDYLENDRG